MKSHHHSSSSGNGESKKPSLEFTRSGDSVLCLLGGQWSLHDDSREDVERKWNAYFSSNPTLDEVRFQFEGGIIWDSTLVVFMAKIMGTLDAKTIKIVLEELPVGLRRLLSLSGVNPGFPKKAYANRKIKFPDLNLLFWVNKFVSFWGEWVLAMFRLFIGKSKMRWQDFAEAARSCGAAALPIVTLISFLTGLTMAFVGSVQLEKFNAKIYVADLSHG